MSDRFSSLHVLNSLGKMSVRKISASLASLSLGHSSGQSWKILSRAASA